MEVVVPCKNMTKFHNEGEREGFAKTKRSRERKRERQGKRRKDEDEKEEELHPYRSVTAASDPISLAACAGYRKMVAIVSTPTGR